MLRNLVFDWSGTLCDDWPLALRLTNETLAHFGAAALSEDAFTREFSLPVADFYARMLPDCPIEDIESFFFDLYRRQAAQARLFADAPFLLHYAHASGYRLFIQSTVERTCIAAALAQAGMADWIEHIEGRSSDKRQSLQNLLKRFDLAPDETLAVGDMPHDLEAAHAAGAQCGAALYGYSRRETLEPSRPGHWFDSPMAIFQHLQAQVALDHFQRPTPTVGGFVFNPRGEILLIRTAKWSNLWGTPGGKIEFGEPAEDAFRREFREETGLEVHSIRFLSTDEGILSQEFREPKHFIFLNFAARTDSTDVRLNYEAHEWRWVRPADAEQLGLNTPTRELLEIYRNARDQEIH